MERGDAKVYIGGGNGGAKDMVTIKGYMDVANTKGLSKSQIKNNDNFAALTVGADPSSRSHSKANILHRILRHGHSQPIVNTSGVYIFF